MSERDNVTENDLIAGFIKWAQVNGIRFDVYSYAEIDEFIHRFLTAAG